MSCPPTKKRKTNGTSMSRAWCYTWNNYRDEDIVALESLEALRHVAAREVGESGTPHIQGYIRFAKPQRFSWWKNQFPSVHVEPRHGTEAEASAYVLKDGDVIIDIGTDIKPDLKRTRENAAMDCIQMMESGATIREVYLAHPTFYFFNRRSILSVHDDIKLWQTMPDAAPDK